MKVVKDNKVVINSQKVGNLYKLIRSMVEVG